MGQHGFHLFNYIFLPPCAAFGHASANFPEEQYNAQTLNLTGLGLVSVAFTSLGGFASIEA